MFEKLEGYTRERAVDYAKNTDMGRLRADCRFPALISVSTVRPWMLTDARPK